MIPSPPSPTRTSGDKKEDISIVERADSEKHGSDADDRLSVEDFGGDSSLPPPPILTPVQEKALYRKVDMRLMPILTIMYLLSLFLMQSSAACQDARAGSCTLHPVGGWTNGDSSFLRCLENPMLPHLATLSV